MSYYDNKGIRHSSEYAAEKANEEYRREELHAREQAANFQREQAEIQAKHNARVEAQMEQQAREEAIHREYNRDIQWLERSDAKGKFELLASKVHGEFVDRMAHRVFNALVEAEAANSKEKALLNSAFRSLAEANDKWVQADTALKTIEGELEKANKLANDSQPGCAAFGCLPIAIIFAISMVSIGLEKYSTTGGVIAGIIGGLLVLFAVVFARVQKTEKSEGVAKKTEVEPKLPQARKAAETTERLRQKALLDAMLSFATWSSAGAHSINTLVENIFESGDAQAVLVELVATAQSQYPPLCRVDTGGIDLGIVQSVAAPLQQAVRSEALELHTNRSSVLERLGASSNHEKFFAELYSEKISGATSTQTPATGEPLTRDEENILLEFQNEFGKDVRNNPKKYDFVKYDSTGKVIDDDKYNLYSFSAFLDEFEKKYPKIYEKYKNTKAGGSIKKTRRSIIWEKLFRLSKNPGATTGATTGAGDSALGINPDSHEAWYNLGIVFNAQKNYEKAIECYENALEIKPDSHEAWYNLGIVFNAQKNYEKNIECYVKSIASKPDKHEAWNSLGNTFSAQKEYQKAENAFLKALEIKPNYDNAFYNLACLYSFQKQKEKAFSYLQQAISLNPEHNKQLAQTDSDFEWLWEDKDFRALVSES